MPTPISPKPRKRPSTAADYLHREEQHHLRWTIIRIAAWTVGIALVVLNFAALFLILR
ncbi:MAG: hypothetical protein ACK5IB_14455 [Qingshengfaniella sp.]